MNIDQVIDSFLVRDGSAVRVHAHQERFVRAVKTAFDAEVAAAVPAFWQQALEQVPAQGEWFPKLAAARTSGAGASGGVGEAEVHLSIEVRKAPSLRDATTFLVVPDRRAFPQLKGADARVTAADRAQAVGAGCDDALYLCGGPGGSVAAVNEAAMERETAAGNGTQAAVNEAANGAVVAWCGDALLIPPQEHRLPSTTVGWLVDTVCECGSVVREVPWGIGDVDEIWYVNALHGLTPVTRIVSGDEVVFAASASDAGSSRLKAFRDLYQQAFEPLLKDSRMTGDA